ncbi:hypothetical protein [Brevundimonas sp.]|uniref:hypothetical protein n=1 Tax=Brevundimonas sp. TaxID=1871086 RepID=UPI002FC6164F
MDLEEFHNHISSTSSTEELLDFCRKKSLHGIPHVFKNNEDDFYNFRRRIANKFEVNFHDVFIVGSANLGFSPHKGTEFSLDSDIDVAIVSNALFDRIMLDIRQYQMELRRNRRTVSERELKSYHRFLEYSAIGWIRPDLLPLSFKISEIKNDWFDFFNSISSGSSEVGNYQVSAGVFKNYNYLENYTFSSILSVKEQLNAKAA